MTSPIRDFHSAVFGILSSDAAVQTAVTGIHDRIPEDKAFPYISFGTVTGINLDASCIVAQEYTMDVHVWSRGVGAGVCYDITDAVKRALHYTTPETAVNAMVEITVPSVRVMDDPDGLTKHGVVTVTARIEER